MAVKTIMKTTNKTILHVALVSLIFFVPIAFGQNQTKKIDAFINEKMGANHIPGLSLAVVRDGKVIFAKGYGMSNLELSVPANEKSVFPIYSITKTFTAVAVMMLVEEGKISLEDSILKHLNGLPEKWNRVTVRHLLTHTSGITDLCEAPASPCLQSRDFTQAEIVKFSADLPPEFEPGERWEYGNTGFFLLGMLIEKVSDKSYEQFLQMRIFTPLEMRDTRLENHHELVPNRADGYTWQNGKFRNALRVSPTLSFSFGGLVSTVLDLAKYDAALYTEKLLKKKTLDEMFTKSALNNGQSVEQGLGFGLSPYNGHRRIGHSGGHTGFAATISRLIDDKITVIVLSNADSKGYQKPESFLMNEIANEIASFYFKE